MKKAKAEGRRPQPRPEYDFRGGTRGKYAARYARGTNVIVLDADIARVFSDSKSVNEALRTLARLANLQARQKRQRGLRKAHATERP